MRTHTTANLAAVWLLLAIALPGSSLAQGVTAKEKAAEDAVNEANARFYEALNAMLSGDPQPFENVWWHDDDVVYMGADGAYNVGWDKTYANWKKQAEQGIGGRVAPSEVKVVVGGELAITSNYVSGVNAISGDPEQVKLRATSVYRQRDGQWKMIRHHVDVLPALRTSMEE